MQMLSALEAKLVASGENQISLTDPDARAMTSLSHSAYTVGYNVQSAVDTKHHLIVAHEVTNVGIDKGQLSSMAEKARDALDADTIEVFADKGYYQQRGDRRLRGGRPASKDWTFPVATTKPL